MARLRGTGLDKLIPTLKQPLFGICLGMQILFETSEEGPRQRARGAFPATSRDCSSRPAGRCRTWAGTSSRQTASIPLLDGVSSLDYVYFVHSYAVPRRRAAPWPTTDYGSNFAAVVRRDNFCGTQFHPERSGVIGARILRQFPEASPDE